MSETNIHFKYFYGEPSGDSLIEGAAIFATDLPWEIADLVEVSELLRGVAFVPGKLGLCDLSRFSNVSDALTHFATGSAVTFADTPPTTSFRFEEFLAIALDPSLGSEMINISS